MFCSKSSFLFRECFSDTWQTDVFYVRVFRVSFDEILMVILGWPELFVGDDFGGNWLLVLLLQFRFNALNRGELLGATVKEGGAVATAEVGCDAATIGDVM